MTKVEGTRFSRPAFAASLGSDVAAVQFPALQGAEELGAAIDVERSECPSTAQSRQRLWRLDRVSN